MLDGVHSRPPLAGGSPPKYLRIPGTDPGWRLFNTTRRQFLLAPNLPTWPRCLQSGEIAGRPVFARRIEHRPPLWLRRCGALYADSCTFRCFSCLHHFIRPAFTQLVNPESLRDSEACFRWVQSKLHPIRGRGKVPLHANRRCRSSRLAHLRWVCAGAHSHRPVDISQQISRLRSRQHRLRDGLNRHRLLLARSHYHGLAYAPQRSPTRCTPCSTPAR